MCGQCTDLPLLGLAPFLPYVGVVFVLHAGLVGNIINRHARRLGAHGAPLPIRYVGYLVLAVIVSAFATGGSLVLPFLVVLVVWLRHLFGNARSPNRELALEAKAVLCLLLLLVPVGYVMPLVASEAGTAHGLKKRP